MNYLDYLSGDQQVPQNYVQPLSDQGVGLPAYEAPPVQAEEPFDYSSFASAGTPAELMASVPKVQVDPSVNPFNKLLTPQVKPLNSSEVKAADNPYAIGGAEYKTPVLNLPPIGVSGSLSQKYAPFSGEMDKAIGVAQSATKKMESALPAYKPSPDQYSLPVEEAAKSTDALGKTIQAFEEGTDTIMSTYGQEQEKLGQEYEKINQDFITKSQQITQELDDLINQKIDPTIDTGRFWNNASTGQKVLMGIGMAFAALTPETTKLAIDSIQKAVERDIDAQKQTIVGKMAERKEQIAGKNAMFDNAYRVTGNQQAAIEAMRARGYQQAALMVDQMSKKLSSREALANAQQAKAQLELAALNARQNAHNAAIDQENKRAELLLNARMNEATLRLQKAKIISDEKIAFAAKDSALKSDLGTPADAMAFQIAAQVPKSMQLKAMEERGFIEAAEMLSQGIDKYFDEYNSWPNWKKSRAMIPTTNESNFVDKAPVIIFGPATNLAKGALQEHEFEALVEPFLPKYSQSKEAVNLNKNRLKTEVVNSLLSKTPILSNYGINKTAQFPNVRKVLGEK